MPKEMVLAAITSSPWKRESWKRTLADVGVRPVTIPVPCGLPEPDSPDPVETAKGKLEGFLGHRQVLTRLSRVGARGATVVDAHWVDPDGVVLTTDRGREGEYVVIKREGERLARHSEGGRVPVTIKASCTTATKDMRREMDFAIFHGVALRLYPGLLALMMEVDRLRELVERGAIGHDVVTSRSIMAINWVGLIPYIPALAVVAGSDVAMEIADHRPGSKAHYYIYRGASTSTVRGAQQLLGGIARGVTPELAREIVERLT